MTTRTRRLLGQVATRSVIAALPVAMASAYVSGFAHQVPQPPRLVAEADYSLVAEIVQKPTTVGFADSHLTAASTQAEVDKALDDMLAMGVTNIRVFVPWGIVEQQEGTYNWGAVDMIMKAAQQRNMGVLAEVNGTPRWASTNPDDIRTILYPGSDIPDLDKFANFMKVFVGKYSSVVSAYEIWNEPNASMFYSTISPEAYADMLKKIYPIIKDATTGLDKTATVIAGGLGAVQNSLITMDPVSWVQRMLAAGAGNFFDALAFHPYEQQGPISTWLCPGCAPGMLTPSQQLNALKNLLGGKMIWLTEYNLPTVPDKFTDAQQAAWIKDLLDWWQNFGATAGPVFLYTTMKDLVPGANQLGNDEFYYGLWNLDGTAKAAVQVITDWIKQWTTPPVVTPGQPVVNPIAAFFESISKAVASFAQAFSNIFNPGAIIQSFVESIQRLFGIAPAKPAVVTTTSTATASLAAPEANSDVAAEKSATEASAVEVTLKAGEITKLVPSAALELTPAVLTPEVVTPEVTAPAVEAPVTEPVQTEPTTPAESTPAESTPAESTPAEPSAGSGTDASTSTPAKGDAEGSGSTGSGSTGSGSTGSGSTGSGSTGSGSTGSAGTGTGSSDTGSKDGATGSSSDSTTSKDAKSSSATSSGAKTAGSAKPGVKSSATSGTSTASTKAEPKVKAGADGGADKDKTATKSTAGASSGAGSEH